MTPLLLKHTLRATFVALLLLGAGAAAHAQTAPPPPPPPPDADAGPTIEPLDEAGAPPATHDAPTTPSALDAPTTPSALDTPTTAPPPPARSNYELLERQLMERVNKTMDPGRVSIYVREVDAPLRICRHNAEVAGHQGAVQQLITSAAALDALGESYRFRTVVRLNGDLADGVVDGDLIVSGRADPTIAVRWAESEDPQTAATEVFRAWAREIRDFGIKRITGDVVGDDTWFDDRLEGPDWPDSFRGEAFMPEISALSLNENCVEVFFDAGWRVGRKPEFRVVPATRRLLFHNGVVTEKSGAPTRIAFTREAESNLINAVGAMPRRTEAHGRASVHNPTLFFADVLRDTLRAEGVEIAGEARDIDDVLEPDRLTSGSWTIAMHVSPPLAEIVKTANRNGLNFYADMLFKTLGREKRAEGSFAAGQAAVQDFLRENMLADAASRLVDGSGLSRSNAVTPTLLADVLSFMTTHPAARTYVDSLPSPGEPGALQDRFAEHRTLQPEAVARLRAAASERLASHSLAGYAVTAGGARLAWSFSINEPRMSAEASRQFLEDLAMTLALSPLRGD